MRSTLSSQKQEQANMFQDASSLTSSLQSSTKSELAHTDSSSIQNNLSQERKTQPTTLPEVTTQSEKKLLISLLTESESLQTTVQAYKASSSSIPLEAELDQVSDPFFSKDFPSTMERNQS